KGTIYCVASSTRTRSHTSQYAPSFSLDAPCISTLFPISTRIGEKCGLVSYQLNLAQNGKDFLGSRFKVQGSGTLHPAPGTRHPAFLVPAPGSAD
ncbi:MAG: hypothetical protein V1721_09595, partial [Pseudomonadota bacterium]